MKRIPISTHSDHVPLIEQQQAKVDELIVWIPGTRKYQTIHADYEELETLGSGANAFPVKKLSKRNLITDDVNETEAGRTFAGKALLSDPKSLREISLQAVAATNCVHVAKIKQYYYEPNYRGKEVLYMVMDYYPQTLYGYCKRTIWRFGIQERELLSTFVIKQLAEGLKHLHDTLGIAHRDIKLQNVLVPANFPDSPVVITDFGHAKEELNSSGGLALETTAIGTEIFAAPEIGRAPKYGKAVDIWSLGVTAYVLLTHRFPYRVKNRLTLQLYQHSNGSPIEASQHPSDAAKDLIRRMLKVDTDQRLRIIEVLGHPWITKKAIRALFPNQPPPTNSIPEQNEPELGDSMNAALRILRIVQDAEPGLPKQLVSPVQPPVYNSQ